jgi:hypothetical protein
MSPLGTLTSPKVTETVVGKSDISEMIAAEANEVNLIGFMLILMSLRVWKERYKISNNTSIAQ